MRRSAEAQGRRWLVGFPRHLRDERGAEVLGVVLDLCPPGTDRLPLARRLELLRIGLRARRRELPPPAVWWTLLNASARSRHGMVPDRWRPWLIRRLPTASFVWTWAVLRILLCTLPMAALQVWLAIDDGTNVLAIGLGWAAMVGIITALSVPISGGRWRRTVRQRNGLDAHGEPLPDDQVQVVARGALFRNVAVRGPLALLTLLVALRTLDEVDRWALPVTGDDLRSPVLLAAVRALVVLRGRRGRPVGLWDLVPSAGPLLQREALVPAAARPYRDRRPRRRPPALG